MKHYDSKGYIPISAIWFRRFTECSDMQGTISYPSSVWRFYHSLLNLGEDKLAIKDIIQNYVENEWEPITKYLLAKETRYTTDSDVINHNKKQIELQHIHLVFDRIVQTIQDSGIGWTIDKEMQQYMISQE